MRYKYLGKVTVCARIFLRISSLIICMMVMPVFNASAADSIGLIKTLKGDVYIMRGDARTDAIKGAPVFEDDIINTESNGSVGITFVDGAVMSLGPDSEIQLDDFIFKPQEEELKFGVSILQGTASYLSGRIAKLSPENAFIETPFATIGIRGTRFLVKVAE